MKMDKNLYKKLGMTAKKRINDWEILIDGHPAMIGLSEKDIELFQQMPVEKVIKMLSLI